MVDVVQVLQAQLGSIIAPAGCGKTELITKVVASDVDGRALILTHTNAGVRALRERMRRLGIPRSRFSIETITSWSLRFSSAYPKSSRLEQPTPEGADWDHVCQAALRLLDSAAIQSVVRASFTRLLVDEYQDCSRLHHTLVSKLSTLLPCCVLGDPLQGIFDFKNERLSWNDVAATFPSLGELTTPWRWHGKNEALGAWLLQIREPLLNGEPIDLTTAPVTWQQIDGGFDAESYSLDGTVVAVRKWAADAHAFAASTSGIFESMEEVDCKALLDFAKVLDSADCDKRRRIAIASFAGSCLTLIRGVVDDIRVRAKAGEPLDPSHQPILIALRHAERGDPLLIIEALEAFRQFDGAKLFRSELWEEARRFLKAKSEAPSATFFEAAWSSRNRGRSVSTKKGGFMASRTLLIKGLEFDHAIILSAMEYENANKPGDGAKNFYVAATRGSRSLTILSRTPLLRFSPVTSRRA